MYTEYVGVFPQYGELHEKRKWTMKGKPGLLKSMVVGKADKWLKSFFYV